MSQEEKYKLALFAVIRNSTVMPQGVKLGKTMHEINTMAVAVMANIMESCDFEKRAPHSRYFSDELGALFIYNNIEHMFTWWVPYGIISMWKKIYLLLKKILFRMVEDMCTRFNIIWSDARNTERKF